MKPTTYDDDYSLTCEIEQFLSFRLRFITICQQKQIYSSVTQNHRTEESRGFIEGMTFRVERTAFSGVTVPALTNVNI